jgi:hypothetical protein
MKRHEAPHLDFEIPMLEDRPWRQPTRQVERAYLDVGRKSLREYIETRKPMRMTRILASIGALAASLALGVGLLGPNIATAQSHDQQEKQEELGVCPDWPEEAFGDPTQVHITEEQLPQFTSELQETSESIARQRGQETVSTTGSTAFDVLCVMSEGELRGAKIVHPDEQVALWELESVPGDPRATLYGTEDPREGFFIEEPGDEDVRQQYADEVESLYAE